MKACFFVIAVLTLAIQQPTQQKNGEAGAKRPVAVRAQQSQETDQQESASKPTLSVTVNNSLPSQNGDKAKEESTEDTNIQRRLVTYTGALVAVGIVTAAFIWWQALEIRRSVGAIRDGLPFQRQSSEAAAANAQALINAERAWIVVEIKLQPGPRILEGDGTEGESTGIFAEYICHNFGQSFAQIREKGYVFKIVNSLPEEPDFSEIDIFHRAPEYIKSGESNTPYKLTLICKGHRKPDSMLLIYGRVRYADVFGDHEATFGYSVSGMGGLERLPADKYKKYNQHT